MARWVYFNPNPLGKETGDCVIRAVCAATGRNWQDVYTGVALTGLVYADMPNENSVWQKYLESQGFVKRYVPDLCPQCYTVGEFADDHPKGRFVVGTGSHAVGIVDWICYDTWRSLGERVKFYYSKEEQYA